MYFVGGVLGDESEEPLLDRTEDGTAVSPLSTEVSKLSTKPPRKKFKKGECLQVYVIWVMLSEPHINSTAQGECDQYMFVNPSLVTPCPTLVIQYYLIDDELCLALAFFGALLLWYTAFMVIGSSCRVLPV